MAQMGLTSAGLSSRMSADFSLTSLAARASERVRLRVRVRAPWFAGGRYAPDARRGETFSAYARTYEDVVNERCVKRRTRPHAYRDWQSQDRNLHELQAANFLNAEIHF